MYNHIVFQQLWNLSLSLSLLNCMGFAILALLSLFTMLSVSAALSGSEGSGNSRLGDRDLEGV